MDADLQGGTTVPIKSGQAPLFPLPRPFLLWRGQPQVWAVHARGTTDLYILLANSLSLSNLYFYTVYVCVILYLHTCFRLTFRVSMHSSKRDPSDSALPQPLPLKGAADPGSCGGDVNNDLFAAWVVRRSTTSWIQRLEGWDPVVDEEGLLTLLLLSWNPTESSEAPCTSLCSFLHALLHAPPPYTTTMFFFIQSLTTTAAKFNFSCTWRSLESAPVTNHFKFSNLISRSHQVEY